ncbi:hypothetical protein OOK60_01010 [Trichothermofontia sichuanensis B231]|uniref:hypothetical protein n=1 Tax=Trichothermofontia sichuanensis TaxID=3045816 RepID=UPI0022486C30|nr:hypothetical protein [Trichothermofontia sichuanensis]UZQ54691.1 hypothetical protein OOK60_01010 [Trichothermofontia sichuanensis B231]
MLHKVWQWLQHRWQGLQRWLGRRPAFERAEAQAPPPRPTRSDAEYEALFLPLLENPALTSGRFKAWLISKNVLEEELTAWLHRFGDRLQQAPDQYQVLAQRLMQFGTIVNGPTAHVALKLGQSLYVPPPAPTAGEGDVIEAVFREER